MFPKYACETQPEKTLLNHDHRTPAGIGSSTVFPETAAVGLCPPLSLSLFFNTARRGPRRSAPLARVRSSRTGGCEERTGTVGRTSTATPAFPPQHPNTKNHNLPRSLSLIPPYDRAWSSTAKPGGRTMWSPPPTGLPVRTPSRNNLVNI